MACLHFQLIVNKQLILYNVQITEIYSHTFLVKISSKQRFTKEFTKELIWRIIFSVRVNFHFSTLCNPHPGNDFKAPNPNPKMLRFDEKL